MNPNIDERAEIRDVRHNPRTNHPTLQIAEFVDVIAILEQLKRVTRIPPRLFQLTDDIVKRKFTDQSGPFFTERLQFLSAGSDQSRNIRVQLMRHFPNSGVTLRMNAGAIKYNFAIGDPQESRRKLKHF